jgi:hypothetical protein
MASGVELRPGDVFAADYRIVEALDETRPRAVAMIG